MEKQHHGISRHWTFHGKFHWTIIFLAAWNPLDFFLWDFRIGFLLFATVTDLLLLVLCELCKEASGWWETFWNDFDTECALTSSSILGWIYEACMHWLFWLLRFLNMVTLSFMVYFKGFLFLVSKLELRTNCPKRANRLTRKYSLIFASEVHVLGNVSKVLSRKVKGHARTNTDIMRICKHPQFSSKAAPRQMGWKILRVSMHLGKGSKTPVTEKFR